MENAMEPNLKTLMQAAQSSKPSEFQTQAADLLGQRVVAALDTKRQEMAQAMFFAGEEIPQGEPEEVEVDTGEDSAEINSAEDQNDEVETGIEEPNG